MLRDLCDNFVACRDALIIAPPDNGRVLAFVLPTLVHILAQPPVQPEEGPVLGPTALPAPPPHLGVRECVNGWELLDPRHGPASPAWSGAWSSSMHETFFFNEKVGGVWAWGKK